MENPDMPAATNNVEGEVEVLAGDAVRWFKHIGSEIVGFFHASGPDTDGVDMTTIKVETPDGVQPLTAPSSEFVPIDAPVQIIAAVDDQPTI